MDSNATSIGRLLLEGGTSRRADETDDGTVVTVEPSGFLLERSFTVFEGR